jgi:hypothetical protein
VRRQAAQGVVEQLPVTAVIAGQQQVTRPRHAAQLQLPSCPLAFQVGQHEGGYVLSALPDLIRHQTVAAIGDWKQAVGAVLQQQRRNLAAAGI